MIDPFVHRYLLWGLLLTGVPLLVHLVMRQQPKRLAFPAFRFLKQRARINRRKLRLQHLLLLLLRMGIIAALCLALARPRLAADRLVSGTDRAVSAVMIFDTRPSMEYTSGGQTRLDDARQKARELLDEMADGSQVAILDTGDAPAGDGSEWLPSALVPTRLDGLRIRPANGSLNRQIDRAVRLLDKQPSGQDAPPRFLYVFSDRTRSGWDGRTVKGAIPAGLEVVFVDVGIDGARDLAIDKIEVVPPVVEPGERMEVLVTVRASGAPFESELVCGLDNDNERMPERQAVQLGAGQSRVFAFELTAPPGTPQKGGPGSVYQVTARLLTSDALPINNARHATFLTRERRKVLTLVDDRDVAADPPSWKAWQLAINEVKRFRCDVRSLSEADKLSIQDLRSYPVVCVFESAPRAELWTKLAEYVRGGGGLIVVPGDKAEELPAEAVNLMPGKLQRLVQAPKDEPVLWSPWKPGHLIGKFFITSLQTMNPDYGDPNLAPRARAYWEVEPADKDALVVATYADDKHHPALLERAVGRGRSILFTTPMDARTLSNGAYWHNYWSDSSFGLVLVDQVCRYLAGDLSLPELNYLCGQVPQVTLPVPLAPPYTLQGPNLTPAETTVKANEGDGRVELPQAVAPGNYAVFDNKLQHRVAGCSLNVRAEESLLDRVPAEEIEEVLGKGSVVQAGRSVSLKEALQGLRGPPVELLPWLMIALLLVLTAEGVLANRFYRRSVPQGGPEAEAVPASGGS
jgi:hypothetical protein